MRVQQWSVLVVALPLLSACGGGGDVSGGSGGSGDGTGGGAPGARVRCPVIDEAARLEITALLNDARIGGYQCGTQNFPAVGPVAWNDSLYQAARIHSEDMAAFNFFDHLGSDGLDAGMRIAATGYPLGPWGENIAAGYTDYVTALEAWLGSPDHCRVIMEPAYVDFGLACADDAESYYGTYWTLDLAAPK